MSWDDVAISGVGWSSLSTDSGQTPLDLALTAVLAAAADAGIDAHQIDGIVDFGRRDGPLALPIAAALGLPQLRYFLDYNGGGVPVSGPACGRLPGFRVRVSGDRFAR